MLGYATIRHGRRMVTTASFYNQDEYTTYRQHGRRFGFWVTRGGSVFGSPMAGGVSAVLLPVGCETASAVQRRVAPAEYRVAPVVGWRGLIALMLGYATIRHGRRMVTTASFYNHDECTTYCQH